MSNPHQDPIANIAVDELEVVEEKRPYTTISSPSIIDDVRALRKAAGLEGTGATGPSSAIN
jgi:hypothetical protein